ncbi:antibiotic biosynthesis monooxygenase [Pseudoprimorskyibacter insulae]|uniref:ABM domain-containing protein n=1 Tax=Pseudoprimorskyibacter insulae TaxID=1695997 RepID=A0A2R8AQW2_9RHOB|nr:antibiotic biosynthesis monooxygenase [Pseudoprimorskyibacter insulae]SPF78461.1 hypothetical protein PRI8871_01064 [Pseudoprimorskyibacter insulae]
MPLTILNTYALLSTPEAFTAAIEALAARVETEGHPGIRGYRFFVNAGDSTARAVIDYDDAAAWIGHHDIAMPWPEMKALHSVARLTDVVFLGDLTPEIQAWIDTSTLTATIHSGNAPTAGFTR